MNIIVLIKLVSTSAAVGGEDTNRLNSTSLAMNPADANALEMALALKKKLGAKVTVISMGPARAKEMLRECYAKGADRCVLICDPALAGSDTLITSMVLSEMIAKEKDVGLVLCGRRAVDSETGHIGPQVAAFSNMVCLTGALAVEVSGREADITVLTDHAIQTIRLPLPSVVTVCPGINYPSLPSIMDVRNARNKQVEVLDCGTLGLPVKRVGTNGSPTVVATMTRSRYRMRSTQNLEKEQGVHKLFSLL